MKYYDINTPSVVDSRKIGYIIVAGGVKPFSHCGTAERVAAGYLVYVEDAVPVSYAPGGPLLVRDGDTMRCTWPNASFDPALEAAAQNAAVTAQIAALEIQQTPRRLREAALTAEGKVWLATLENQIAALRAQLV